MFEKISKLFSFAVLFLLTSCATGGEQFSQKPGAVSVMTYNLENLFDTKHDEGTEDHSYLPLEKKQSRAHKQICKKIRHGKYRGQCYDMDWNKTALNRKMKRLADVILQVNNGRGPDLLIVEEIENMNVLNLLNDNFLKKAQYTTKILIEGFDKRGIDVAMLSRLPEYKKAELHKIPYKGKTDNDQKWMDRSRGILQANLLLPDKTKLSVFGVHFPSGSNPTYWRQQSLDHLNTLLGRLPKGTVAIAGGDFNINASEDDLYKNEAGKKWIVSHLLGCEDCRGTNYYHTKRQWSFLDTLLFHKDFSPAKGKSNWEIVPKSIGIPNYSVYQKNRFMSPARFEVESPIGVSDHWPMFAILKPRKK